MYTYTKGFYIKKRKSSTNKRTELTTQHIVNLCETLTYSLGDGWIIIPEPATTEGGLLFLNGKYPGYKCLRFRNNICRWLCVGNDTLQAWNNIDEVIVKASSMNKHKISIWLIACNGAPCWTREELFKLEIAFNNIGFKRVGRYPDKLIDGFFPD
jgi:hypothetical protein